MKNWFKKRIKMTLMFKSGNSVDISVTEYSLKWNRQTLEYTGYNFEGAKPSVDFVPSQLECVVLH